MDFKNVDLNGGNVAERNSNLCNLSVLKVVNIEPPNKVRSFFSQRFNARKTSLFISFTSLIGME
jgi:hypothetical protein